MQEMCPTERAILVTGGAGFIGSCFVRNWLAENEAASLVNLDKLTYAGHLASLGPCLNDSRLTNVAGDVGDRNLVAAILAEYRPRAIVHFAAESHVDRSIDGPPEFLETNVVGTFQMLDAAREYWKDLSAAERESFRFLHISTDEVFGSARDGTQFTEASPFAPNSPYAASKAAADHFVRAFHRTYGLPAIITNASNNYGPYQYPEKLIPLMILAARDGRPLPIYGDGGQVRDWIYVEDHVRALCVVLNKGIPGEVYLIGGGAQRSNRQVVEAICNVVDELCPDLVHRPAGSLIRNVPDRPGHDRRYAIDYGKIERELDWRPTTDFQTGLRKTVRWYLEHGDWLADVTRGNDAAKRLGLGFAQP